MTEYSAKRNAKRCPTHPGAVLREDVLPAVKRPKTEIADLLGISRQQLNAILSERKPISPAVAVRLESCSATARAVGSMHRADRPAQARDAGIGRTA